MTGSQTQTGSNGQTTTTQVAPPPFRVPADSACVENCDNAPLGWSTPAVGAANLPAGAQGGEADMIGCWQVAPTTEPHGDSATSSQEETMQLYVSADGAGGNENLWFRVRDGSFTSWTSLMPPAAPPAAAETLAGLVERATQAEADAGSDNTRYMTPSLVKRRIERSRGVAKAWGYMSADGTLSQSHGCAGSRAGSSYTITLSSALSTSCIPIITVNGGANLVYISSRNSTGFTASFKLSTHSSNQKTDFAFLVYGDA